MLLDIRPSNKSFLSMTSLIDVVFILLLFFMITTSFQTQREIAIGSVVASSNTAVSETEIQQILLREDSQVWLNGRLFKQDSSDFYQQLSTEGQVILAAEPNVPLQSLVSMIDALKGKGYEHISLAETQRL